MLQALFSIRFQSLVAALCGPAITAMLLAAAPLPSGAAGAALRDPETAQIAADQEKIAVLQAASPKPQALPASVDSDIYFYIISPGGRTNFLAAGRLILTQEGTSYKGTFLDYNGQKTYAASATTDAEPVLTMATSNGKFVTQMTAFFGTSSYSGQAITAPKGLVPAEVRLSASTHESNTLTINSFTLAQRIGRFSSKVGTEFTGSGILLFDGNGRLSGGQLLTTLPSGAVAAAPVSGTGYVSSGYLYGQVVVGGLPFAINAERSGGTFDGFGATTKGKSTSIWVLEGTTP